MAPGVPKQLGVRLPENEEVARLLLEKHRSMLEKGLTDNLSLTLSTAYRNVCGAKEHIRTLKDLLKIKGVGPWVIRLVKESFPESSPDLFPPKIKAKGKKGNGRTSNFGASDCSVSIPPLSSQGTSELQPSSTPGSAEFTSLDKDTDGLSNSILAMPPRLCNEKFLEAYEVVLVLDDRETFGSHGMRVVSNIHSKFRVPVEIKRLPVGDGIWIARHRRSRTEYVLDFIVERKGVTDLVSSIRDSRYKDQKLRLKKCGLRKLIYLVEGDPNALHASESVKTACLTTEILEGFDVQRTTGYPDTEKTYGHLTLSIIDYYSTNFSSRASTSRVCLTYDEFVKKCSDPKKLTVSDIFALQLMQVPHVTEETALAVTELYPTLLSLARAYSMLDGNTREQEQMLNKKSKMVNTGASRNIFKLVWSEG
ncbi:hypothetical protein ACQ4PT_034715 [Festuca glaucescens]